jgi:hypothetical protein
MDATPYAFNRNSYVRSKSYRSMYTPIVNSPLAWFEIEKELGRHAS